MIRSIFSFFFLSNLIHYYKIPINFHHTNNSDYNDDNYIRNHLKQTTALRLIAQQEQKQYHINATRLEAIRAIFHTILKMGLNSIANLSFREESLPLTMDDWKFREDQTLHVLMDFLTSDHNLDSNTITFYQRFLSINQKVRHNGLVALLKFSLHSKVRQAKSHVTSSFMNDAQRKEFLKELQQDDSYKGISVILNAVNQTYYDLLNYSQHEKRFSA